VVYFDVSFGWAVQSSTLDMEVVYWTYLLVMEYNDRIVA